MPDRFLTAQSSIAGCLFQSAVYGACMSLFGMPVDALLLGAIAAGIAHGLREQTTRRVGWSRIGIGTLLAIAAATGAPAPASNVPMPMRLHPTRRVVCSRRPWAMPAAIAQRGRICLAFC